MEMACPTHDTLMSYTVGELPDYETETISDHLDSCTQCESVVAVLEECSNGFVTQLRTPRYTSPFAQEPELQAAVDAAGLLVADAPDEPSQDLPGMPEPIVPRLRDYRLLGKLGQGGMGTVYKALHTKLQRLVAIKTLPAHRRDEASVSRFALEMQAVGKLDHPNIVRAFDAGEDAQMHYLVMELVQGVDVHRLQKELRPLPIADACEIARQVALGLEHAHKHGLVHRDIKPSNLMVSGNTVKLLDLGLALLEQELGKSEGLTRSGQVMGTLDYMAPEQANDSHEVDIRADIYSLGCTLYKLLAGRAPFRGQTHSTSVQKIRAHAEDPPPPIRDLREEVPEDLATLVHSMLRKQPAERPQTPTEVATALLPFATGSDLAKLTSEIQDTPPHDLPAMSADEIPVVLKQPIEPQTQPKSRATGQRPRPLALAALLFFAIFAAGVIIVIRRDGQPETTLDVPDGSQVSISEQGKVSVELPKPKKQSEKQPESQVPIQEQLSPEAKLWRVNHCRVAFSLGERWVAALGCKYDPEDPHARQPVVIRSLDPTENYLRRFQVPGDVHSIAFAFDDEWLILAGKTLRAIRPTQPETIVWEIENAKRGMSVSPDGEVIAAYLRNEEEGTDDLTLIQAETGKAIRTVGLSARSSTLGHFSRDGSRILLVHGRDLQVQEVKTGKTVWEHKIKDWRISIGRAHLASDGYTIRVIAVHKHLSVKTRKRDSIEYRHKSELWEWDTRSGEKKVLFQTHTSDLRAISPDGRTLAFGNSLRVSIHQASTGDRPLYEVGVGDRSRSSLAFSPRGEKLAVIRGSTIYFHHSNSGELIGRWDPGPTDSFNMLDASEIEKISQKDASEDQSQAQEQPESQPGPFQTTLEADGFPPVHHWQLAFSPSGKRIAALGYRYANNNPKALRPVVIRSLDPSDKNQQRFEVPGDVESFAYGHDESHLILVGNTLRGCDVTRPAEIDWEVDVDFEAVRRSSDGSVIAAYHRNDHGRYELTLIRADTGKIIRDVGKHPPSSHVFGQFSSDGNRVLLLDSDDEALQVQEVMTGKKVWKQKAPDRRSRFLEVHLTADGSTVIASVDFRDVLGQTKERRVIAWDTDSGEKTADFQVTARLLAISPDGEFLTFSGKTGLHFYSMEAGGPPLPEGTRAGTRSKSFFAFSPDSKTLVNMDHRNIKFINPRNGEPIGRWWPKSTDSFDMLDASEVEQAEVIPPVDHWRVAFSSSSKRLAALGIRAPQKHQIVRRPVVIRSLESDKVLEEFSVPADVRRIAFTHGDSSLLLLGKTLRALDLTLPKTSSRRLRFVHTQEYEDVRVSPDGKFIATYQALEPKVPQEYRLRLIHASTGKLIRDVGSYNPYRVIGQFSADGSEFLLVDRLSLQIQETVSGKVVWEFKPNNQTSHFKKAHLTSDGSRVVATVTHQTARGVKAGLRVNTWDTQSGEITVDWPARINQYLNVLSPDGKLVGITKLKRTQVFNDSLVKPPLYELPVGGENRLDVVFSPDGKKLVAIQGTTIQFVNPQNGEFLEKWRPADPRHAEEQEKNSKSRVTVPGRTSGKPADSRPAKAAEVSPRKGVSLPGSEDFVLPDPVIVDTFDNEPGSSHSFFGAGPLGFVWTSTGPVLVSQREYNVGSAYFWYEDKDAWRRVGRVENADKVIPLAMGDDVGIMSLEAGGGMSHQDSREFTAITGSLRWTKKATPEDLRTVCTSHSPWKWASKRSADPLCTRP